MFSWAPDLNMLLALFLDVNLHRKWNVWMTKKLRKMDGNVLSENVSQKYATSIKNT